MNERKKKIRMALCLLGITALVLVSGKIPFWIYEERILSTDLEHFFSVDHLALLLPLVIILLVSGASIFLLVKLRRQKQEQNPETRRFAHMKNTGSKHGKASKQKRSGFMTIRWTVMILFSLTIMFGGILLGFTITGIDLPVLACPTNRSQLMESSCYFLAHLPDLFEEYEIGGILLFFLSTIGFILLLGRVICGFLCPMGLIQDIMHQIRQKTKTEGVVLTEKDYGKLTPVKWLLVLLMLGAVFAGGNFCDFCPALAVSPIAAGLKVSLYFSGFMMILVLVGSFFKRRAWCCVCPLGFMIGLFHKLSPFRIHKDTTACTECGACYEACPMGIKTIYTEREKTDVTDINCIMCGECVRCCPEDNALALTFAGKKLYNASRAKMMEGYGSGCGKGYEVPNHDREDYRK